MTMQGLMGSIDNQYVSQVRSMAQQATDAAYAFYHRCLLYTSLIIGELLDSDLQGKALLDMGI